MGNEILAGETFHPLYSLRARHDHLRPSCGPAGRPHEACFISRSHRPRQRASWTASHLRTTWRSQQVALPSTCERAGVQRHQVGSGRQDTSYRKQGSGHGRADLLRHEQRRADEHAKPAGAGSAPRRRDLAVRLRRGHAAPHDGDARDAEPDTAHLRLAFARRPHLRTARTAVQSGHQPAGRLGRHARADCWPARAERPASRGHR